MNLETLLLVLWMMGLALSQQLSCNTDPNTYGNAVKIGSTFVVCVHFKHSNSTYQRGAFPVTIDRYTALTLTGAYNLINPPNALDNSTIIIQTQNSNNTQDAVFFYKSINKIAQMMSFIVYANNGVVQAIEDDNSAFCNGCNGICAKYTNNKNESKQNCYVDANSSSSKDPKIFLSWSGTDSSGQYLLSQTQRIGKFTQYSMNNVFDSALQMFQKISN